MGRYDDIINLPHWEPKTRQRMSAIDRAGQFAPFAALTGYDAMVAETSRLTGSRVELDEEQRRVLDGTLADIVGRLPEHPCVRIVHFVPDARKNGGEYVTSEAAVRDVELPARRMILKSGESVCLDDILAISLVEGR